MTEPTSSQIVWRYDDLVVVDAALRTATHHWAKSMEHPSCTARMRDTGERMLLTAADLREDLRKELQKHGPAQELGND